MIGIGVIIVVLLVLVIYLVSHVMVDETKDWDRWEIIDEDVEVDYEEYESPTDSEPIRTYPVKADRLRRVCKKTGDIEYKLVKRD